jgi:hypothetical protein
MSARPATHRATVSLPATSRDWASLRSRSRCPISPPSSMTACSPRVKSRNSAQCGLGPAIGVQHHRRRQAWCRSVVGAGARALLVSHWAVDSEAATRLTTSTFDFAQNEPKLGRAEVLRRSMLTYLDDASSPRNAHPAIWAPFALIGEGAARWSSAVLCVATALSGVWLRDHRLFLTRLH